MEQLLSEASLHLGLHHLSLLQLKPGCTSFDASKMTRVRFPVSTTRLVQGCIFWDGMVRWWKVSKGMEFYTCILVKMNVTSHYNYIGLLKAIFHINIVVKHNYALFTAAAPLLVSYRTHRKFTNSEMKPQVTTGHIVELAWHKNVHLWAAMHYKSTWGCFCCSRQVLKIGMILIKCSSFSICRYI